MTKSLETQHTHQLHTHTHTHLTHDSIGCNNPTVCLTQTNSIVTVCSFGARIAFLRRAARIHLKTYTLTNTHTHTLTHML